MKRVGLIALLFCIVSWASAQSAKDYQVDKAKSAVKWEAKKVIGGHEGTIGIKEGVVRVADGKIAGGNFVIDMPSLVCTDVARVTGHLKNEDFFDVEKFPTATFAIVKVDYSDKGAFVTGKLTIKGITKDISFPAAVSIDNTQLEANATVKVNRLDYDIKYRSGSFFADLGNRAIEDEFTVHIQLVASPSAP